MGGSGASGLGLAKGTASPSQRPGSLEPRMAGGGGGGGAGCSLPGTTSVAQDTRKEGTWVWRAGEDTQAPPRATV